MLLLLDYSIAGAQDQVLRLGFFSLEQTPRHERSEGAGRSCSLDCGASRVFLQASEIAVLLVLSLVVDLLLTLDRGGSFFTTSDVTCRISLFIG